MNRYLSLVYFLGAFFYFSSCESYNESTEKIHKSDKPIVLKEEHVIKFSWMEKISETT